MKRLALLALVFATATVSATVSACGDDGGDPPVGAGRVTATVGGTDFKSTLSVTASRPSNVLTIVGVGANGRQISIVVNGATATGAVAVGAGSTSYVQYSETSQQWLSNLAGGTGTVTLTTLSSTHATGTFSVTGAALTSSGASGTKAVTSGSFDVSY